MNIKSTFLALFYLLACTALSQAQTPQVIAGTNFNERLCTNTINKIPVQIFGNFNTGNRFQIELLSYFNRQVLGKYEAIYENGNLIFTIDSDLQYAHTEIYFQIVTTSPVTKSYQYERRWNTRGTISISLPNGQSDTLNTGLTFSFNVNATANNYVTFTLSDSSAHQSMASGYQQTSSLVASKDQDIFIVKAVNSCGVPVPFSGKIPVKINPISIIPGMVKNQTVLCGGSDMELSYFVTGGSIPETATFKLRFFKQGFSDPNEKRTFEIPAQRKSDGLLIARIPDKIVQYSGNFQVAILVDKPGLVSSYSKWISIYQKPTATFRSQSETVKIGENFDMWFDIDGPAPFTIELSNGISYNLDNNKVISVAPTKTESYSIRSLKSACGVTTDLPKENIVLTIPPSIAINVQANQMFEICENQLVRLPFVSNGALNSNTKFLVEGLTDKNISYQFDAKLVKDSLEFFIPHSPAEWNGEGYFNIRRFRVKTTSPSLESDYRYGFTIRGIPRIAYEVAPVQTLNGPQYINHNFQVYGGVPVTIMDDKGNATYVEYQPIHQMIFVPKTGMYGLKSIKNVCYSNTNLPALNVSVAPYNSSGPSIVVHPPVQKYLCNPDSVEIYFEAFGQFDSANEFQIFNSGYENNILLTVKSPGRYKIHASKFGLPSYNFMAVRATKPQIASSATLPYIIDSKPELKNSEDLSRSTAQQPRVIEFAGSPYIGLDIRSNVPYTATYSDGVKDYIFEQRTQYDQIVPQLPRSKTTPFTIKSISNVCGTTNVNVTTHLLWVGYQLSMKYLPEGRIYCAGEEMIVPLNIERGTAPAGTVYALQIRKGTVYKTVATNTTGEDFRYMIPDTMVGRYGVSIAVNNGLGAGGVEFMVNKKPTGTIALRYPSMSEIEYGQTSSVVYTITGGEPWELVLKDRGNIIGTGAEYSVDYYLTKGTVFELNSISNQCGYGTVSGSETVRVKPKILEFKIDKKEVCRGEKLQVRYQVGGDIPVGEKIYFYLINKNGTRFDLQAVDTPAGKVALSMPPNLGGEGFELTCYVSGTDVKAAEYITIQQPADIEVIGNTTVNSGASAWITLRSTSRGNLPIDIVLSDGTSATFNSWSAGAVYSINVVPRTTTTYSIASAISSCGNPKFTGSVVVTVNPPAEKTVQIVSLNKWNPLCENDTLRVSYSQTGTFSAGNQFTAQFYDSQGRLAKSAPTTTIQSSLQVILPTGFSTTDVYRIRLLASDPNTSSGDYQSTLQFGTKASASFGSTVAYPNENGIAKVAVLLSGTGPWNYRYGNELGSLSKSADVSPDTLLITSKEPAAYFKLLSVRNGCGNGTIAEPSIVKVELVLGNEPAFESDPVTFGPNPTQDEVTLQFTSNALRQFFLYGAKGAIIWQKTSMERNQKFDVQQYPSGIYLLKIQDPKGERTLKIIKK